MGNSGERQQSKPHEYRRFHDDSHQRRFSPQNIQHRDTYVNVPPPRFSDQYNTSKNEREHSGDKDIFLLEIKKAIDTLHERFERVLDIHCQNQFPPIENRQHLRGESQHLCVRRAGMV